MRVDALLSQYGYCSRKEAQMWVKQGRIVVEGTPVKAAKDKVEPREVLVDGKPVPFIDGLYVALNKPLGYTCSHKEEGDLVDDLLPEQWLDRKGGVQTVGRLDKETSGLLLVSDDGQFVHALTSPKRHVPKLYQFTTEQPVPESAVERFASGEFMLDGACTPFLPAEFTIDPAPPCARQIVLHDGRYPPHLRPPAALLAPVLPLPPH